MMMLTLPIWNQTKKQIFILFNQGLLKTYKQASKMNDLGTHGQFIEFNHLNLK